MLSEADKHLLDRIRNGDADGWNRFIGRFQRRLINFATRRVENADTAEDLVQDTFVQFLQSLDKFRQESDLETYLFQILRRRVIDHYRSRGSRAHLPACSSSGIDSEFAASSDAAPDEIASEVEVNSAALMGLESAIRSVTSRLRDQRMFRDLRIAEGVFYAGLKNRELASKINCDSTEIATVKHRLLQRISTLVYPNIANDPVLGERLQNDLLTRVWELQRPSCPKRTTLGKFVVGILPDDWSDYVNFHVNELGCNYCTANLTELGDLETNASNQNPADRLFQSTIGFLASN